MPHIRTPGGFAVTLIWLTLLTLQETVSRSRAGGLIKLCNEKQSNCRHTILSSPLQGACICRRW